MENARSVSLFLVAGLCEIGGGYLVWIWLREGKSIRVRNLRFVGELFKMKGVYTVEMLHEKLRAK